MRDHHFGGWVTRNDLVCTDGRVIRKDAFQHNDGQRVPLVWSHQHNDPFMVLGHVDLENRKDGVYGYLTFNGTEAGTHCKTLVEHGDIVGLSIYANRLKQQGANVLHGDIKEVSLVMAGANPGAFIDSIIKHGEESDEEAIIYTGEAIELCHSEEKASEESDNKDESGKESDGDDESIQAIYNSMTEKQKNVCDYMVGKALEYQDSDDEDDDDTDDNEIEGGNDNMKHNAFDKETQQEKTLSHSEMQAIFADGKRLGSLKEGVLAHAETATGDQDYGIIGTDWLFPEDHNLNPTPEFIKRETGWVGTVMNGVHHSPFSRIKSVFADITEDDARAKGYIKGNMKKEEVFGLLKRSTAPTTIYKKQKMDRDDIIDITTFDVVAWIKREMRMMLDEEIARAILVGDGRSNASDDKINELNVRPIWTDEDLFTIKTPITVAANATADEKAKAFIRGIVKARKNYKGSGNPTLFTTEDTLTDCLLMEDSTGRIIYDSIEKLKAVLRVSNIVTVPVMEGLSRQADGKTMQLMALIVNLKDYNVGADKGGAINMFEDFDIDYNQEKYLIETRCSGALTKPYSAMAIEMVVQ